MGQAEAIRRVPPKEHVDLLDLGDVLSHSFGKSKALVRFISDAASSCNEIQNEELGWITIMLMDEINRAENTARNIYDKLSEKAEGSSR